MEISYILLFRNNISTIYNYKTEPVCLQDSFFCFQLVNYSLWTAQFEMD